MTLDGNDTDGPIGDRHGDDDEPIPTYADYGSAELLEHAQGNLQALFIATADFLQERGVPVDDWVEAVGARFVRAWDTEGAWDADELMDAMLVNFRAAGAEVVSAELAADRAVATLRGFPDPAAVEQFVVDPALADRYHDIAAPIASALGLRWSWHRDGDLAHLVAERSR